MSENASDLLLGAAIKVEQMEAEFDRLRDLERKYPELIRRAYRRGYLAGRSAQRRGAPEVTNPERTARGWVREALR